MKRMGITGLLIVALFSVSACGVGRSSKQTTTVTTITTGQQLTDLKAALDAGAISENDYEKKRKEILKNG